MPKPHNRTLSPGFSAFMRFRRAMGMEQDEVLPTRSRSMQKRLGSMSSLALHQLPYDILAQSLMAVADRLALIIGDRVSETVIDEIFSRFCVGK